MGAYDEPRPYRPRRKPSKTLPLFDAEESRAERDRALERVSENAGTFMDDALTEMIFLRPGTYTGEEIRDYIVASGIEPHHHNAWGALIRTAIERGMLQPTGEYRRMTMVSSHARVNAVYRVK